MWTVCGTIYFPYAAITCTADNTTSPTQKSIDDLLVKNLLMNSSSKKQIDKPLIKNLLI
jgi:hypothetical protein